MRDHIYCCHKVSKTCAAHPEHGTVHFNNVVNITISSDSTTPQEKQNGRDKKWSER